MHEYSPLRSRLYAEPGLCLASKLPQNYYFHALATLCHQSDKTWLLESFYVYGWPSTVITAATRKKEGKKLFDQLNSIIHEYSQQYKHIKIRLIGFSHGGNVILNMLSHLPFMQSNVELDVILLGTPIQELTRQYINSPWITKAYSFYTDADWMQRIDIQKLQNCHTHVPWFSKKQFQPDDQVIQIKLTVNGCSIGHRDYRAINHYLPKMLRQIDDLISTEQKTGHVVFNLLTEQS